MTLGLTPVKTLRHFRFSITKDYSGSDTRQAPLESGSVTLYKQGATTNGTGSIASGGGGTITVHNRGGVIAGDTIFLGTDTSITATVSSTTQTTIVVSNVAGGTLTWADGDRVHPSTNQPSLYSDILSGSAAISNPLTADAQGLASCYAEPLVVDAIVSHASITSREVNEVRGAWSLADIYYADAFPGATAGAKIAAALAALDSTYGGIVDARGLVEAQSFAANPFASVTKPFLLLLGAAIYSADVAISVSGNNQRIHGLGQGISVLKTSGSFPSSGKLLQFTGTTRSGVKGLSLDCNSVASSSGLEFTNTTIHAHCHDVEIINVPSIGIIVNTADEGVSIRDVRIGVNNASAVGIRLSTTTKGSSIERVFITSSTLATIGINVQGAEAVSIRDVILEGSGFTDGISVSGAAQNVLVDGVRGNTGTVDLITVGSGGGGIFRNLVPNGATNSMNDVAASVTLTADVNEYRIGTFYGVGTFYEIYNINATNATPTVKYVVPSGATEAQRVLQLLINGGETLGLNKAGLIDFLRIAGNFGTPHDTGDYVLSGGWGTTASISDLGPGATPNTDMRGTVTVTSAGTGQAANPTVTLTLSDGAYNDLDGSARIPICVTSRVSGSQQGVPMLAETGSGATITFRFGGTPVNGENYTFAYIVIG